MHPLSERPAENEFAPYYARYIERVADGDVLRALSKQCETTTTLVRSLPEERGGFRYAPGKWSVREVLGHVIDAERIFGYRALTFARGDTVSLPGFDEDNYARASNADRRTLADLAAEFEIVRRSTIALFHSFDETALGRRGKANNVEVTVRALAFITAGHELHHADVLRTKYLGL